MSGCILWRGYVRRDGYGQVGKATLAHRAVWEAHNGSIPDGYLVHHACGNRTCVNPEHLELMTLPEHNRHHGGEHLARANAERRAATHCKHGHPFNEANTYWTRAGYRSCRRCDQARPPRGKAKAR